MEEASTVERKMRPLPEMLEPTNLIAVTQATEPVGCCNQWSQMLGLAVPDAGTYRHSYECGDGRAEIAGDGEDAATATTVVLRSR